MSSFSTTRSDLNFGKSVEIDESLQQAERRILEAGTSEGHVRISLTYRISIFAGAGLTTVQSRDLISFSKFDPIHNAIRLRPNLPQEQIPPLDNCQNRNHANDVYDWSREGNGFVDIYETMTVRTILRLCVILST